MKQAASTVFVVRPARFGFNAETAESNNFQQVPTNLSAADAEARAVAEFGALVETLRSRGVQVRVFDDTPAPAKPDAVFPNNWLSLHADGRAVLYPMCAPNRRPERRPDIVAALGQEFGIAEVLDLSGAEAEGRFLEGTGSIIFDHEHRRAYAGRSPRTEPGLLADACAQLGYQPVSFPVRR
ncbi:arginine deiminase-related protein [Hymenobacter lapidiphilus]|uniref:arginine deiminase-related protein n=1 Tax=Hymenobacter sp. CCM 8763 TaxID=2303334 RepID=UPI0018F86516|nr:arginine deiminase-related protein [Hymenobacter sp. CCM 8763]